MPTIFTSCTEAKSLGDEGYGVVTVGATLAEWVLRPCIFDKPASGDARSWMLSLCEPCETTNLVERLPTFECRADVPSGTRLTPCSIACMGLTPCVCL